MAMPDLVRIYQCLCDQTRLRILNLLQHGPVCVCHLQEVLQQPQVKISKHLSYLRASRLVEAERFQNWMIYSLPESRSPELEANLRCLQDCSSCDPLFNKDLKRLEKLQPKIREIEAAACCGSPPRRKAAAPAKKTANK